MYINTDKLNIYLKFNVGHESHDQNTSIQRISKIEQDITAHV